MYREIKFSSFRRKKKYGNKSAEYNGARYDSKFESKVAQELDLRKAAGELVEIQRQVTISLDVNGYHVCNYRIDFIATHVDGMVEYIEAKGFATREWMLKWKLFEALYADKENVKLTVVRQ